MSQELFPELLGRFSKAHCPYALNAKGTASIANGLSATFGDGMEEMDRKFWVDLFDYKENALFQSLISDIFPESKSRSQ